MSEGFNHDYDVERNLSHLKDFQRSTAEEAFRRLYIDEDSTDRFLIADEAGLGKTMTAKGLIAQAVSHLWDHVERIDVLYVCSNASIARQNISRLNFTGKKDISFSSRLTLIPSRLSKLTEHRVNFISFTPSTSFNMHSSGGIEEERIVLYYLLKEIWGLDSSMKYLNMLQCTMGKERWRYHVWHYDKKDVVLQNEGLVKAFEQRLDYDIRKRFEDIASGFSYYKQYDHIDGNLNWHRHHLIGQLRHLLAEASVEYLEPDLVILDEFQRFKDIMNKETEMGSLAAQLFDFEGDDGHVKLALLSATPFKMYTVHEERADDDHYEDFINTLSFLLNDEERTAELKALIGRYRDALYGVRDIRRGTEELASVKKRLQSLLRRVMLRTERYSIVGGGEDLIEDRVHMEVPAAEEIGHYADLDQLSRELEVGRPLEYWKSSPYLLNIMDDYQIKRVLKKKWEEGDAPHMGPPRKAFFLEREDISGWQPIDPSNAKMRVLFREAVEKYGLHEHLWIPASMPYYKPWGRYREDEESPYTKTLIFSSWQMVPKAIAMLASYEVERQMSDSPEEPYEAIGPRGLLRFAMKEDKPQNMASLAIFFPAISLAREFDPCEVFIDDDGEFGFEEILNAAHQAIRKLLDKLGPYTDIELPGRGSSDALWAYLARLDAIYGDRFMRNGEDGWPTYRWLDERTHAKHEKDAPKWWEEAESDSAEEEKGFPAHINRFIDEYAMYEEGLPRPDEAIIDGLARLAVGSPAAVALRALLRQMPHAAGQELEYAISAAAAIAQGFRSLFNRRWSLRLLKAEEPYWERVLEYCLEGNLQSVMDEYVHVITDIEGLREKPADKKFNEIASTVLISLNMRAANPKFDVLGLDENSSLQNEGNMSLRTHFALRFGDDREVTEIHNEHRTDIVRIAFNSPFRPFIFASTSIGQEGLDFHSYCHSIFHWNLPGNPVDLEQREGRINRYKGHLIRKNLVNEECLSHLRDRFEPGYDPWELLFDGACMQREESQCELMPFWVYEGESNYRIIRHVPLVPLSKDLIHFEDLKRSLMFYRMVFGQPRQQDLVEHLKTVLVDEGDEEIEEFVRSYMIDLSPKPAERYARGDDTSPLDQA